MRRAIVKGVLARLTTRKYISAEHVMVAPMGTQGRSVVDDLLAEQGFERRVARKTSSFWSALVLVSRSDYAATLPAAAVNAMSAFLDLKVKKAPFPLGGFNYDLVWHRRVEEDPAQRWFRALLLECAGRVAGSGLS